MDVPVLLIADDLTGAAEAAAAFLLRTPRIVDLRTLRSVRASLAAGVVAVDTDSRYVSPELAAERCRTALDQLPPEGVVVKKIDSTLRGPLAAELTALREPGGLLVVASALPALGRTVVGGAVLVDGVPLERSAAWAAEPRPAPSTVAEALAPLPVSVVELPVVRGGVDELAAALLAAADADRVAVCDAETDADLDRLVAAGVAAGTRIGAAGASVRWAGSAGLAHALARAHAAAAPAALKDGSAAAQAHCAPVPPVPGASPAPPAPGASPAPSSAAPILFVVGTAAQAARDQLARLAELVPTVVELGPDHLDDHAATAAEVAERTAGRTAAVHLTEAGGAARSPDVVAALARVVEPAAREHPALVLTGGETARAVLAAIGVGELRVREAWDDGVVVSTAPGGRVVVTKPGAFGDPHTLARIVQRLPSTPWQLHAEHSPHEEDT
ncbi:four-carbon acid sugar kinase family protein [Jiangella endophytica]|uniref:four-carbon acid sugar kinase family protein n=1 Tax=Jiangella endophytica TaxID=1623398 RepID=UPI001300AF26|nr:four-carbon acid sugar kinase family protein [Jiangella endophytica]